MVIVTKWGDPKPGFEWEYGLAWRHRHLASVMLLKVSRSWWLGFRPSVYRRAFRLWAEAVDRTKQYGQDRLTYYP